MYDRMKLNLTFALKGQINRQNWTIVSKSKNVRSALELEADWIGFDNFTELCDGMGQETASTVNGLESVEDQVDDLFSDIEGFTGFGVVVFVHFVLAGGVVLVVGIELYVCGFVDFWGVFQKDLDWVGESLHELLADFRGALVVFSLIY